LPVKSGRRRQRLEALAMEPRTIVLYESPHRLLRLLQELVTHLGPERRLVVARELTKRFEEVRRAPLDELARHYAAAGPPRGEIVLVIAPPGPQALPTEAEIDAALRSALGNAGVREAAAEVAARYGRPRREVYARALALKRTAGTD
jgi:16S rRNA (cytidine1402-2'-O)-methyltransferase